MFDKPIDLEAQKYGMTYRLANPLWFRGTTGVKIKQSLTNLIRVCVQHKDMSIKGACIQAKQSQKCLKWIKSAFTVVCSELHKFSAGWRLQTYHAVVEWTTSYLAAYIEGAKNNQNLMWRELKVVARCAARCRESTQYSSSLPCGINLGWLLLFLWLFFFLSAC